MAKIGIDLHTGSIKKDLDEIIIGIDLGTTNSLVAIIENNAPKAIVDPYGNSTLMPSIVHFGEDIITIGQRAKEMGIEAPERTIYSVKRLLGKTYMELTNDVNKLSYRLLSPDDGGLVKVVVGDKYYSPVQLSSLILKGLKERIENILQKNVSKAVITVPAYFNDIQRQATRDAGKLAGLDVLRIINEPTAASLAYGLGKNMEESKNIVVFDLGGGTFDVSILHLEEGIFEVLSTNGDTSLGGDDIDDNIMDHWEDLHELIPTDFEYVEFRALAQKAKTLLTTEEKFQDPYQDVILDMDRALLEELMQPLLARMKKACQNAMNDSHLALTDIDEVLLVGGSTRMPIVKELVKDFFQQKPNDSLNPDEAVALGAAIQADVLAGNRKDILLLDVTPLSLGIETVGGLMDVIIPRNSKVPHSAGRSYTTSVDGQTNLKVAIYQGERDLIENNRLLGEFILSSIPPMAAGIPKILIKFVLNTDGILQVTAVEERSGTEQTIIIKSMYEISDESMAEMLMDSVQNAEEDMKAKALIETRVEALHLSRSTTKFIQQNHSILNYDDEIIIQDYVLDLNGAIGMMDKDEMEKLMDELNTFAKPIAEDILNRTIKSSLKSRKI